MHRVKCVLHPRVIGDGGVPQPMQEISLVAGSAPLPDLIKFILERPATGNMLENENTPEAARAWKISRN